MQKELKVRISDRQAIERELTNLGATLQSESEYRYLYFNQPKGQVLKLTYHNDKVYKTVISANGDQFDLISNDEIQEVERLRDKLTRELGVKREIINMRRFYKYKNSTISTNQLQGMGDFLIIESQEPDYKLLTKLKIYKPIVVTESFDNI